MNNWISVKDRMPEMHQRVITWTTDNDGMRTVWMAHWNGYGAGKRGGFLVSGGYRDKDVTHWMPLPEPPK